MKVLRVATLGLALLGTGCDGPDQSPPDDTLVAHAVLPSTPNVEGRAYVRAVMSAHERAEAAGSPAERAAALRAGLAVAAPASLGEAQVLRLELAVSLCETLRDEPGGPSAALAVLRPMLDTKRSLPVDRVSAKALTVLGDLAHEVGDDALAAGSYARAIRMMSMLQQELMP